MHKQVEYIWLNAKEESVYAEFKERFVFTGTPLYLRLTCAYRYALFINGTFVANGQFRDVPNETSIAEYKLSAFARKGENELLIKCFYTTAGFFQYQPTLPYLAFEITEREKLLVFSSPRTLSRRDLRYEKGDLTTLQLGQGYNYSFTSSYERWKKSVKVSPHKTERKKDIQNIKTEKKRTCNLLSQGLFKYNGGNTAGEILQNAWLSSLPYSQLLQPSVERPNSLTITTFPATSDGIFLLGDLGEECAGYPYFKLRCNKETTAYLGWGEHLKDLRIRTFIGGRNFATKIRLKKGVNDFADYLHRIGGRYLCLFIENVPKLSIESFGLTEALYPLNKPEKDFGDALLNKIYQTGRRTLELCMHESYEDCPWREQALYGMDSRHQMLFGYTAFKEYAFPRSSLRKFAKGIRQDGLLELCPPACNDLTIPSFCLYWIWAVYENVLADYNETFLIEVLPAVEKVLSTFISQTKKGMVYTFKEEKYWNFHEWSDGLDGNVYTTNDRAPIPDCILTAVCYRAAKYTAELEKMLNNFEKAERYEKYANSLIKGFDKFYDKEKQLFASYIKKEKLVGYHELTQAILLGTGALSKKKAQRMSEVLQQGNEHLIPTTLAGLALKYEALIEYCDGYEYCIKDVVKIFSEMLYAGATSFWETQKGEADFDGAGSLCHGWAAVGCYVLDRYANKNKQ